MDVTKRVMLRRMSKVIRWIFHAALTRKLYLLCLASLVAVALSWNCLLQDYTLDELSFLSANCLNSNDMLLGSTREIWKAESSAASTMLTLLPVLLVFVPFRTARIRSMIVFSTSAALLTSSVTLGLATSNIFTLPRNKVAKVVNLCTDATVRYYAVIKDPGGALSHLYLPGPAIDELGLAGDYVPDHIIGSALVPRLQLAIAGVSFQTQSGITLRGIMSKAASCGNRPTRIWLSTVTFGFFFIQAYLLYMLIALVPGLVVLDLLWVCQDFGNSIIFLWLISAVVLAGLIRTFAESSKYSKVEIFHLRPLSGSFVFEPCANCVSVNTFSQQDSGPLTSLESHYHSFLPGFERAFWCMVFEYLARLSSFPRRLWAAQKSREGMVVMLRPSEFDNDDVFNIKKLLFGVFGGFFQAVLLIFMTVLFGSTYNTNILLAAIFLISFMTLTVISRTYSIYFCAWLEQSLDAIQIEYATPDELNAIRTILSGMPSVFIHNTTLGSKHAAGNRLDQHHECRNHPVPISTPQPKPTTAIITALLVGILVLGITIWLLLTVMRPADPDNFFKYWAQFVFVGILALFFLGMVVHKVYSDIEFMETQMDYVGDTSPV